MCAMVYTIFWSNSLSITNIIIIHFGGGRVHADVEARIEPGFEPGCSLSDVLTEPLELCQWSRG